MHIEFIRIQNFKGFKNVTLELKPLTLLLGPNSSGKSSLCRMLVALSKIHKRGGEPSFQFDEMDTLDLGSYSDIVHLGQTKMPVTVGIAVASGYVEFQFGGGKDLAKAGISDSSLTHLRIIDRNKFVSSNEYPKGSTMDVEISGPIDWSALEQVSENLTGTPDDIAFTRLSVDNWRGRNDKPLYELSFVGLRLRHILAISDKTFSAVYQRRPFNEIATILSRTSYLRPDRESPRRIYYRYTEDRKTAIGDRGEGTAWYIRDNWESPVSTYRYNAPTSDLKAAKEQIAELDSIVADKDIKLCDALAFWLGRLGLLSDVQASIPLLGKGKAQPVADSKSGVNLRGRVNKKAPLIDLPDLGYGVSQALPVLVAGLTTPNDGLLVVEEPEAELHPLPQAELADFFCSMVKCGKSVLIETHSEEIFHRLRLRAEQDKILASKIAVYFIDAPGVDNEGNFTCKTPKPIPLDEGAEFSWPDGFLSNGIEIEQQIRAARVIKAQRGDES
jgi:ABC-type ATPase involved in cell division